ncbi:TetR family transcriptional regulator [Xylanimonas cellulosilytica]|uniref:TetR/AcrR family transcriptional regulator n=1 Tax=Xylanimonas cellulosilytica TaxID=186189 RepID=UPI0002EA7300|nr:TetR family transcriptional regulator [Xylanimonas cellulosilytica]
MADESGTRRGRRPAGRETRGEILAAARVVFLEQGYDATSVRAVARRAGVDPGTVRHWFGDKARLFAAALGMSDVDPGAVARDAIEGPLDGIGTRLVRHVLETWDADDGGAGIRLALPVALADPEKRALLPQYLGTEILGPIAARLDPASARLRASLAATQMVGVLLARYVIGVEPIASLPAARVAELVGPTLERYLVGSFDPMPTSGAPLASEPAPEHNSPHGE